MVFLSTSCLSLNVTYEYIIGTVTNFTTTLLEHSFVENNIKATGMTYPIMKKLDKKSAQKVNIIQSKTLTIRSAVQCA